MFHLLAANGLAYNAYGDRNYQSTSTTPSQMLFKQLI